MTTPFQRRSPGRGQPPLAAEWNGFIEVYQAYARSDRRFFFESAESSISQTTAKVSNQTGGDLDRFSVVELLDPLILPSENLTEFQTKLTFEGILPTSATGHRLGILWDPIGVDSIGRAVIAGVVTCQVDVTNEGHWCAAAKNGDSTQLESGLSGPLAILWKEPGTGTKWAILRFGEENSNANENEHPDAAYIEYLSAETDANYIEFYPAYYFVRNLDSDGSVEWVPAACWAQMANPKTPTLEHLYPGLEVDNETELSGKPAYTTEGTCCDDDRVDQAYSGYGRDTDCPPGYCWDETLQECVCCDSSCCGENCWDEILRRCFICCEEGQYYNPETSICDDTEVVPCGVSGTLPTPLRCTIELVVDEAGWEAICPGDPYVVPFAFPLHYHAPGDPDPFGYTDSWYGDYYVSPNHYATINIYPACWLANGGSVATGVPADGPIGGHIGNTGVCPGAIVMSGGVNNMINDSFTSSPFSLVTRVGYWRITVDEYP